LRLQIAPRLRAPLVWLVLGGLLLGLTGLFESVAERRLRTGWDDGARHRLERRATIVEDDFARFLARFLRPLSPEIDVPSGEAALFETVTRRRARSGLADERYGLSVYGPDGGLLAWDGNATDPPARPREVIDDLPERVIIGGDAAAPRLYAFSPTSEGALWVAEYLLRTPILPETGGDDRRLEFDFLPRWSRVALAHVQMGGTGERKDALERLFARHADRLWGRMGRHQTASLTIPIRADEVGPHIASVTLLDRSAGDCRCCALLRFHRSPSC
jgi:hypothetical protein